MKDIILVSARPGDEKLIHSMMYSAFLPLYERYKDDETSPVKEPIDKVIAQLKSDNTDYYIIKAIPHNPCASDTQSIKADSKPVGAIRVVDVGLEDGEHIYRISPLFILPEYQDQGIGHSVISMILDMYGSADVWRLSTIKQEKGNCHLYEKCGFVLTGEETHINDRMTIVCYEKRRRPDLSP